MPKKIVGKKHAVKPVACGSVHVLCTALVLLGSVPAANAELLFSAKVAGPVTNLYSMDSAGSLRKVTDNIRWRDMDADIAPDRRIVFSSNREPDPKIDLGRRAENFHIYLTDGSGEIAPLTSGEGDERMPRFSPDGETVAFIRRSGNRQQLVLSVSGGDPSGGDPSGGNPSGGDPLGGNPSGGEHPIYSTEEILDFSWAPDGRRLCLATRRGGESALVAVDIDGGKGGVRGEEVLARGGDWIVAARWAPDGRYIALIRHPQQSGERRLTLLEMTSGRERQLSPSGVQVQGPPDWSVDGTRLLYAGLMGYEFFYDERAHKKVYRGSMQLFESALGGDTRQLSRGEGQHRAPVYSPDGSRIAYLYAPRLDARTLALHTANPEGGDRRELYGAVAQRSGLRWFREGGEK